MVAEKMRVSVLKYKHSTTPDHKYFLSVF